MAPELTPERRKDVALKAAREAASKARKLIDNRDRTIRLAHHEGASLREIAEAVEIPHVTVSRIIARQLDMGHSTDVGDDVEARKRQILGPP